MQDFHFCIDEQTQGCIARFQADCWEQVLCQVCDKARLKLER
uniref:Uncharacterized protein n=1 Tax=Oryza nivara TaxID=4536 RepID=A0A0E0IAV4_ORYNI